jgi:hypothetical protein
MIEKSKSKNITIPFFFQCLVSILIEIKQLLPSFQLKLKQWKQPPRRGPFAFSIEKDGNDRNVKTDVEHIF